MMYTAKGVQRVHAHVRIISIVKACEEAGIFSVPLLSLHAIAYFSDALAPVWNIPVVEAQILKRIRSSMSPQLQHDIDDLVGMAVLLPTNVRHVQADSTWRLDANYSLNHEFTDRIFAALRKDEGWARELMLTREVTLALSGLGVGGISGAVLVDANYSDPLLDFGNLIDLAPEDMKPTRTAQVTERFASLMEGERACTDAELTHLYVRHLYSQLQEATDGAS